MRISVACFANFTRAAKGRALLAAACLVLGPTVWPARAQSDLATIRLRADQGDPEAVNRLAGAYADGQGVAQNLPEALRLYQQAADRGLASAQFSLGMMHELGRGVPADRASAFGYYLKAAEQGFAPAQFNVGNMYSGGLGVKQDLFEAALWFRRGAEAGLPGAQYNLALAYEAGRGVAKNEEAAQKWYRAAAAQGIARACYNLALMREEGRGSTADPASAMELYRTAALQNYAPAQNNLGILLAEGRATPVDLPQAYAWLALAVENGAKPLARDTVAAKLSSSQRAEADGVIAKLRAHLGSREAPANPPVASGVAAAPAPVGPPSASERELGARLAAAQSDLANLLVEHARLREVAKALARDKSALEKQLAARGETRAAPDSAAPADRPSVAEAVSGIGRVSAPPENRPERR